MKDSFTHFNALFFLLILAVFVLQTACKENTEDSVLRKPRSIKDAFRKDDRFASSRAITDMRFKIFHLESSVKNMSTEMSSIHTEMEKISAQNTNLRETAIEQTAIMETLNGEIETLKQVLAGHGDLIGELETLATADENLFAVSNQTCGGVLVGQSGSIRFSSLALRGKPVPSTCIWTIRANNRRTVKVTTSYSSDITYYSSSSHSIAYVFEVMQIIKANDTINTANLETKITKLQRNVHHIFTGPVIFVVYELAGVVNTFELSYEGLGKLTAKDTFFSHESLSETTGRFGTSQMESSRRDGAPDNAKYSWDYASLVISNFSTKAYLEAAFENDTCGDNDTSFLILTDLISNSSRTAVDCCKQACAGKDALINYGDPFIILMSKRFQMPLKFNISWGAETRYPSTSGTEPGSSTAYKCGGRIGGISGSIFYKPRVAYRNDERCIWVIVPQPGPRSSIKIDIGAHGIVGTSDLLYMMELTNADGTDLTNPNITHLRRFGTYYARSRELYIVFYTDSERIGQGFSLSWKSVGDLDRSGKEVSTNYTIFRGDSGQGSSLQLRPARSKSVYQVFIITPMTLTSHSYGMQFVVNQTQPSTPSNCNGISIYTALNGLLRKGNMPTSCSEEASHGSAIIHNADGMALIVVKDNTTEAPPVAINFSWQEQFGDDDSSFITVEDNQCGGVIIAEKGILKYKVAEEYYNNERCIWLLQTPNHTRISLDLLKDGFETCCDNIMVNTINPLDGTLKNDTKNIDRANHTRTFLTSVLVITFRSDSSSRGRGFVLRFHGRGEANESSEYRYQLRHYNELRGEIDYPSSSDWEDPISGVTDILVVATSIEVQGGADAQTLATNISWSSGVFKKEKEKCNYESIVFYTSAGPRGWLPRKRLPEVRDMESCPSEIRIPSKAHICSTAYSAFLAIYRHLPIDENEEPEDEKEILGGSMGFIFEKSSTCGGVIIGHAGEISYKEDGKYANREKCIWLVQAPQAKKINFVLEKSDFEVCCDLVYIYTINRDGTPVRAVSFQQGNITSAVVDGPVAIVIFSSDHSVNGLGFRLTYSTTVNATEPFPFAYLLEHRHEPMGNRFAVPVEEAQLVVTAFSKEPFVDPLEHLGRTIPPTNQINVTSMRTQIAENCASDTLTVYNVLGRVEGLVALKSFSARDILKGASRERIVNGNCTALGNGQFTSCESIADCSDAPTHNVLLVNGTSFVAVYKSVNVSSGDLKNRGFVMVSSINETSDFEAALSLHLYALGLGSGSGHHGHDEDYTFDYDGSGNGPSTIRPHILRQPTEPY